MPVPLPSALVQEMVAKFKAIVEKEKTPPWAFRYNPPIPFIGQDYPVGGGLLIYGSAEELTWLPKTNDKLLKTFYEDDKKDFVRRWHWFEHYEKKASCNFFPTIGVAPLDSGGLLAAGWLVAKRCGLPHPSTPREFLETCAVSNWCKFTILCMVSNHDYADDVEKLKCSLPYVIEELSMLKPAVVIMPATTYNCKTIQDAIKKECDARFVPLSQFDYKVINMQLKKLEGEAHQLQKAADPVLAKWMSAIQVKGAKKGNHWRYLVHVKSVLKDIEKICEDR